MKLYKLITKYSNNIKKTPLITGLIILIINIIAKDIDLKLTDTQRVLFRRLIGREIILFLMLWTGTDDILLSLLLTFIFFILFDHILNENSKYCVIPDKLNKLKKELDLNGDGEISNDEIDKAISVLKSAKKFELKKNDNIVMFNNLNF